MDRDRIRDLLRHGEGSVTEIAAQVRCSIWAVYEVLHADGAPRPARRGRVLPPLHVDQLRRLYQPERRTIAEIAAHVGCSPDRVRKTMLQAGIPRRLPGHRADDHPAPITAAQLDELYTGQQLTVTEVADRLGCTRSRVIAALDRHRIERRVGERRTPPPLHLDAPTLTRLYVTERLDDAAIAARYRVPTWPGSPATAASSPSPGRRPRRRTPHRPPLPTGPSWNGSTLSSGCRCWSSPGSTTPLAPSCAAGWTPPESRSANAPPAATADA